MALDTATEQAIQRSLGDLAAGRTTLVIAHRLGHPSRMPTAIVVVDENGLVEQGLHRDLVAADGVYRRLHDAQYAR